MEKEEFIALADKISNGTASDREIALYNAYFNRFQQDAGWDEARMGNKLQLEEELKARMSHLFPEQKSRTRFLNLKWMVAAASVVMISFSAYLFVSQEKAEQAVVQKVKDEITPGGNKAILTLADGSEIILNNSENGVLAHQGSISVKKLDDGRIIYQVTDDQIESSAHQNVYNSISTPRGGQFQVDLPDGTKVWLNSATTLRYPTVFTGTERVVTLSGEAYFEVARVTVRSPNGAQRLTPFKVIVNDREEVQVFGTHFNIMAYNDDNQSKTTLLEGSVQVVKGRQHRMLVPGQQATIAGAIDVTEADIEEAVAWKNGLILFKEQDLKTIMKQISRWYDVDILYKGNIPNRQFTGGITRKSSLANLLKILELNNIHFSIHNRTITVRP